MPLPDDKDFDPTTLLNGDDDDQIETPEGEEEHDFDEGAEDGSSESGDDQGQDETEEGESGTDGLEAEPPARELNGRERRSQTSWNRREEKFRSELEAEKKRTADTEARLRLYEEERQRQEASQIQRINSEREERLAQMTPDERNSFEIHEMRAQIHYQNQMREYQTWDVNDKAQYEAIANSDTELGRVAKRNASIIEKHLTDLRGRNTNMPRMVLLKYELGDQVLKALEAKKQSSKSQPTRKTPKAPASRGDGGRTPARSNPSSEKEARKKRLENVRL